MTVIRTPLFVLVIRTTKIQTLTAIRTPLSVLVIRTVERVDHPKHPSARTTDLDSHSYSVIRSRTPYYENTDTLTAIRTPLSVLVIRTVERETFESVQRR